MSDIVERLRAWVYTDSLYATAREAADEIERLRGLLSRTGSVAAKTGDDSEECHSKREKLPEREQVANHQANLDSSTLTDEEREAVEWFARHSNHGMSMRRAATLRGLLERLSNPPATDRQ